MIVTFQGSDAHRLNELKGPDRQLIKFLLSTSDHVTGVSESLLTKVRNEFPDIPIENTIVPNGAYIRINGEKKESNVQADKSSPFVLTGGHLILRKGFDVLIQAISILKQEGSAINLVVIGDGNQRRQLEKLAQETRTSDRT